VTSQTALTAAACRAAHLIVDRAPYIFADTLAYHLLGAQAETFVRYHRERGDHPILCAARAAAVTRSRFTEDRLAAAAARGVDQYVILGAGLDSFAYRSPLARTVRVFEVDHPDTQDWKRGLTRPPAPETLTFVPVDFERDVTAEKLFEHGFDATRPAFVSWLGVTMYLTAEAIDQTLATIGGWAPGTEVVLDSMLPEDLRDAAGQAYVDGVRPVAAAGGEPWRSYFRPAELTDRLQRHGLAGVSHVAQHEVAGGSIWAERSDALRPSSLSVLTHAVVAAPSTPA
jgi:methyltransferase (TIGR00027 family)